MSTYMIIKIILLVVVMVILLTIVNKFHDKKQETKMDDNEADVKLSAEDSTVETEARQRLQKENRRWREAWEQMSEIQRNKHRGEENPRIPEEEKALEEEAKQISADIDRRNAVYKSANSKLWHNPGIGIEDIIKRYNAGVFVFVDSNVLGDEEWAELNDVLWLREAVQFVRYQNQMRLTQVTDSDRYRQVEEHYRIWHPNSSVEEQAEYMQNVKKQDKELNEKETAMLESIMQESYPCKGFDMPTAEDAYGHFHGNLNMVIDYGDFCNGHYLHTWDDGARRLCRCSACGGLVLVQDSEYHGPEDNYYIDFFPVRSHMEAKHLNETYGGLLIEQEWKGKSVFYRDGKITGHNWK